ncbi:hypothetical protein CV739_07995 [Bacillus velezensis]|nr:hypothetical protein EEB07_09600 [Bacillus velezensis]PJN85043.1 hypothetical protein CV739_07995 [Bacillus velezensis]QAV94356.1 hypothetical protein ES966_20595 [Bacillus velezensis]QAW26858.1 hypothetical protein ETA12_20630 [Bacillus velezensis]QAW52074.1 hypothetical protein ETK69_21245 [Bacillus velezensis]
MCGRRKRWLSASFFREENFGKTFFKSLSFIHNFFIFIFYNGGHKRGETIENKTTGHRSYRYFISSGGFEYVRHLAG